MKEAVIDRRTLEIIFRDQKAEIDNWSDRHLWYATATGCYNVYRCRTTFRLKRRSNVRQRIAAGKQADGMREPASSEGCRKGQTQDFHKTGLRMETAY